MELYLLRHGIAEDGAMSDAARRLTPEGTRKLRSVLRTALQGGVAPGLILSSPLVRARQTAELAAVVLGYKGEIIETDALVPGADPKELWDEVRTYHDEGDLLMATHNPLVSEAAGYLLGQPGLGVHFGKASMMCLEFRSFGAAPKGLLRWFLAAKLGSVESR